MSCFMRKPAFSICETKGTDQWHSNSSADRRCLGAMPLFPKFKIVNLNCSLPWRPLIKELC